MPELEKDFNNLVPIMYYDLAAKLINRDLIPLVLGGHQKKS